MKISASKVLALGGLCALLAGAGNAAFAQGYDRQDQDNNRPAQQSGRYHGQNQYGQNRDNQGRYNQDQNSYQSDQYRQSSQYRHANQTERRRLDRLHATYAHAAENGNYNAVERAHQHAQAIRARLHDQNSNNRHDDNNRDNSRDNNQDQRDSH